MQAILMMFLSAALSLMGAAARADEPLPMPVPYSAIAALPVPTADAQLAYGDNPLQTQLRFDPIGQPRAELVFIHGGCWSADYSRDHTLPLAGALRDAGFRVWLPEYRRVGDEGGGWPGTWEDVQRAVVQVADQAEAPLIVAGHSAGGHLALLLATVSTRPVAGAVGLAPITDLVAYGAGDSSCQTMTPRLIGAPLALAEPLYREASPAYRQPLVPVVILQGEADPIVAMSQATAMKSAELLSIPEAGHFDLIHPGTEAFPLLVTAIEGLLP